MEWQFSLPKTITTLLHKEIESKTQRKADNNQIVDFCYKKIF